MNHIIIHTKEYEVPGSWNELSTPQALRLFGLFSALAPLLKENPVAATAMATNGLLKMLLHFDDATQAAFHASYQAEYGKRNGTLVWKQQRAALGAQILACFAEVDEDGLLIGPRYALTKRPYSALTSHQEDITFYAPDDGIANSSLEEMATVFTLLESYAAEPLEATATRLFATVFRPSKPDTDANLAANWHGDRREPYIPAAVELRVPHFAGTPPLVRGLLLFWLASCRAAIIAEYPNLFTPPSGGERIGNDYGWAAVIMALAGELTKVPAVASTPWQEAYIYMSFLEDQRKVDEIRRASQRRLS